MTVVVKMSPEKPNRPRRRRLKYIAVLPTMLTLGNLLCGFAAIHFALRAMVAAGAGVQAAEDATLSSQFVERLLPSFLSIGAVLIFLGMLFDMLDGLAARLANKVSAFGAQIDSLADVVSFGVAPAILAIAMVMREWSYHSVVSPLSGRPAGRAIWICAAAYAICAAIRLARYNVEQMRDTTHRNFHGLPSPGAAAVLAALLTLHEHTTELVQSIIVWSLPVTMLGCAFLMISRIPYNRITETYLFGRRPFNHVALLLVFLIVFFSFMTETLAVACMAYALYGPVAWLLGRSEPEEDAPVTEGAADPSPSLSESTKEQKSG